jgi:hypothetical protein
VLSDRSDAVGIAAYVRISVTLLTAVDEHVWVPARQDRLPDASRVSSRAAPGRDEIQTSSVNGGVKRGGGGVDETRSRRAV